jgi:hypothetical protein
LLQHNVKNLKVISNTNFQKKCFQDTIILNNYCLNKTKLAKISSIYVDLYTTLAQHNFNEARRNFVYSIAPCLFMKKQFSENRLLTKKVFGIQFWLWKTFFWMNCKREWLLLFCWCKLIEKNLIFMIIISTPVTSLSLARKYNLIVI